MHKLKKRNCNEIKIGVEQQTYISIFWQKEALYNYFDVRWRQHFLDNSYLDKTQNTSKGYLRPDSFLSEKMNTPIQKHQCIIVMR